MENKIILKTISGLLLCSMVGYTLPVFAYEKDETVYSKLDNTGNNYKTIVSTHIKNTENEELINDMSDLLNIKNTNGDETFTQDGNKFTWNANKNDIYYQGETQKELPIECKVTYELDGEEISANDIAGKSGNVKIKLEYTNKEERTVDINGKKVKMYVPFVVVAGTIIKNDNNQNVAITNGKVVDDGSKTIVVGIAMPGLQESLGLSEDEVEIPSNIEITMDSTDFESESIISYVTPKVLEKDDLEVFDKLDEVYSQVNKLQSASKQLVDGSKTLNVGTHELSGQLNSKISQYESARNKYSSREEIRKALLNTLDKQMPAIVPAIEEQVQIESKNVIQEHKEELEKSATETAIKYTKLAIKEKLAEIDTATANSIKQAEQEIIAGSTVIKEALKTAAKAEHPEMTEAELEAYANKQMMDFANKISTKTAEKIKEKISQDSELQANINKIETELKTTINSVLENTATELSEVYTEQISSEVAKNLIEKQLNGELSETELDKIINQYYAQVNGKLNEVDNQVKTLKSGLSQLTDGTEQLATGMETFDKEGISKICDVINGDVKDLTEKVEKLTELSKEYNNFTMLNDGNEAQVKFIMIIDAVKKQEDSEQEKEDAVLTTESLRIEEDE